MIDKATKTMRFRSSVDTKEKIILLFKILILKKKKNKHTSMTDSYAENSTYNTQCFGLQHTFVLVRELPPSL